MQPEDQKPEVHEGMTELEQMRRGMFQTVVRYGLALIAGVLLVLLAPQLLRVFVFLRHGQ
jgi:hypothetical protein